jgi:hypothetical protein
MQILSPISAAKTNLRVAYAEAEPTPAIAHSPILKTALNGLDASLNDELDRYRHWQENGQTISYLNPFRPRAVSGDSVWTATSLAELTPIAPISDLNGDSRQSISANTLKMPMMPSLNAMPPLHNQVGEFNNLSYENLTNLEAYVEQQGQRQSNVRSDFDSVAAPTIAAPEFVKPMSQSSTLDDDDILQNFANDYAEYYEANEQNLAESPDQQMTSAPNPKSALHSLLNPVGIISLLLLLCSSAAIGYLLVDPSSVMKLFKQDNNSSSSQSLVDPKNSNNDTNKIDQTLSAPVPFMGGDRPINSLSELNSDLNKQNPKTDLKTDKTNKTNGVNSNLFGNSITKPSGLFVPSSPPSSLRTVPSTSLSRSDTIAAAPLPPFLAPIQRETEDLGDRANTAPAREIYREPAPVRRSSPSAARSAEPAPARTSVKYAAPLSANPQPAPLTPSAPSNSYRVVVENGYAASAQQVERDAFVRPSDGQVQVGSYRDPNAAQQRLEQLRRQGIPARIE